MPPLKTRILLLAALAMAGCNSEPPPAAPEAEAAAPDYERGPHNGRMLRSGDFALEVTIFEDGVPPEHHVYAYRGDKPIAPSEVQLAVKLSRLDGEVNDFTFTPEGDYLKGSGTVTEPHSFDVTVNAVEGGRKHDWTFASYEGRTTIAPLSARQAGIVTATAGPALLDETTELMGKIELAPSAQAEVGARFPGRVMSVARNVGDRVARGALLARVESNESLQTYSVTSPISGIVLERRTNVGDVTGAEPIFVIADPAQVVAAFPVFPRDMERVRAGQTVRVEGLSGEGGETSRISGFLPLAQAASQTVVARASLTRGEYWRPGMAVRGRVTTARREVPLAVKTSALQPFRDFTVVFAKVRDTFEVRMLELGQQTPEWTEVKGGLKPGTVYAAEGAYVVKADIEKAGASHDH
jgi:cobalt-zinc-cadmium efflux system membrane fusion protein